MYIPPSFGGEHSIIIKAKHLSRGRDLTSYDSPLEPLAIDIPRWVATSWRGRGRAGNCKSNQSLNWLIFKEGKQEMGGKWLNLVDDKGGWWAVENFWGYNPIYGDDDGDDGDSDEVGHWAVGNCSGDYPGYDDRAIESISRRNDIHHQYALDSNWFLIVAYQFDILHHQGLSAYRKRLSDQVTVGDADAKHRGGK